MQGNSYGKAFSIHTFGESHGPGIGVVIDGLPAGMELDPAFLQAELDRRRPGQSSIVTQRKEADRVEILSGWYEGKTLGTPLMLFLRNADAKPADYEHLRDAYRPSHADYTYQAKYGFRDHRGGGRSSARETAARVAAGAVAKTLLHKTGIQIQAYVSQVGQLRLDTPYQQLDLRRTEDTPVRCPDPELALKMVELIKEVRKAGDTVGGVVSGLIQGCPPGLGEPVFDKLHAELGKAMLSINACKGFEYGSGFEGAAMRGSEHNDLFFHDGQQVRTHSNFSGGVQGGISNGMDIYFRVAFKPVATLLQTQASIDEAGQSIELAGRGRHDPCVVPRAVPIVEAMAAIVLADFWLRHQSRS